MPKKTVAGELPDAQWFKSTYAGGDEVAFVGTSIAIRDSKDPDGGAQVYDRGEWKAFLDGVKIGQFDLI